MLITVAGRPAAVLGPVAARSWLQWEDVAPIFAKPVDAGWAEERDLLDQSVVDPWERA